MRDLIARELTRGNKPYDCRCGRHRRGSNLHVPAFEADLLVLDISCRTKTGVAAVPDIRGDASPATRFSYCALLFRLRIGSAKPTVCGRGRLRRKDQFLGRFLARLDALVRGSAISCSAVFRVGVLTLKARAPYSARTRDLKFDCPAACHKGNCGEAFYQHPDVETHRANLMTKTAARNVATSSLRDKGRALVFKEPRRRQLVVRRGQPRAGLSKVSPYNFGNRALNRCARNFVCQPSRSLQDRHERLIKVTENASRKLNSLLEKQDARRGRCAWP